MIIDILKIEIYTLCYNSVENFKFIIGVLKEWKVKESINIHLLPKILMI